MVKICKEFGQERLYATEFLPHRITNLNFLGSIKIDVLGGFMDMLYAWAARVCIPMRRLSEGILNVFSCLRKHVYAMHRSEKEPHGKLQKKVADTQSPNRMMSYWLD